MEPAEKVRLEEDKKHLKHWRRWGPYLSSRQWGTVREDYSKEQNPWTYFPYEMAISRAYRWGEDGIGGICDNHQRMCFAPSFWNGNDPFLKERLFGLTNLEGNHGEDLKEYYFFLDNTPTHAYMKFLYKYPHSRFPYEDLRKENQKRSQKEREFELIETGIFNEDAYFDIFLEYAKASPDDLIIKINIYNRGKNAHPIYLLPTIWARNVWSWGEGISKPYFKGREEKDFFLIEIEEAVLGKRFLYAPKGGKLLATENETNNQKLYGTSNASPFTKDAFHEYVVHQNVQAVNPKNEGTKIACLYHEHVPGGKNVQFILRLSDKGDLNKPFEDAQGIIDLRKAEADAFYSFIPSCLSDELKKIERQAFAGLLWNKQYYGYVVERWLSGDAKIKPAPREHLEGRNKDWIHLYAEEVFSVPDNWEYPAFFSWDLAFHALPLALIDPEFIKTQLVRITREWYMHANGQIPAYEWNFSDVNPPVHAWATWRVYKIDRKVTGTEDRFFLERTFQKLLMNFTWWVNRKDESGKNIFHGGFLGLDNISIFNRSEQIPEGGQLYQSDATSWMGMYCLNMLAMAFELAVTDPPYEDIASKFYEHFLYIADAINFTVRGITPLWNEEDGFYYDVLIKKDGSCQPLKVRSIVGLTPLFAVSVIEPEDLENCPGFKKRMDWFIEHRIDLCEKVACMKTLGVNNRRLLALVQKDRLKRILSIMLDENEFLSPYGIRSLSKCHQKHPFTLKLDDHDYCINYQPGESWQKEFGGNSNWRGPIWFPLNMLIIESLQKYHYYYGDAFKVEFPTGSGKEMTLWEIAIELEKRLVSLFKTDENGKRPMYGDKDHFLDDPLWKDHFLFFEYFHGETGEGLGASHQTGWTALIAKLLQQMGEYKGRHPLKS